MKLDIDSITNLELDISLLCNAKCPLCLRNYKQFNEFYLANSIRSTDDIIKLLSLLKNLKTIDIIGLTSEPTTYPNFIDLIAELKKHDYTLNIYTNGDLYDDVFWKKLAYILLDDDRIVFTICGSTQNIHAKYRINTSLTNIISHATVVRSVRKIDMIAYIIFSYNFNDVKSDAFLKLVRSFSYSMFTNTPIIENTNVYKNNFNIHDFLPTSSAITTYKYIDILAKNDSTIQCQSLMNKSIYIDVSGNIYPCWKYFLNIHNQWNFYYDGILHNKYDFCKHCKLKIQNFLNTHLQFLCL